MTTTANATRKAVVTTAQVSAALEDWKLTRKALGLDVTDVEFDKGFRGKGFALYQGDKITETFETKEDAFLKFSTYVAVAKEIMTAPNVTVVEHASEEVLNAVVEAPVKTTRKAADKPAS
jgi:hypothetical protein